MKSEFYSNGKLLLSGEYAILDGALGLAVPTKYGQSLKVTPTDFGHLEWTSFDEQNAIWYKGVFDLKTFGYGSTTDSDIGNTLKNLFLGVQKQNPGFLSNSNGASIKTVLGFPRAWGLGTSSTLINNLAQWAQVNPYQLLWDAFGGSGYDIACAQSSQPLIYQLAGNIPKVDTIPFLPSFKDTLYFVYLNKKQSSKQAIANYRQRQFDTDALVQKISEITKEMISTPQLSTFETLMEKHENLLAEVLKMPPIKAQLFPDYPGAIKSLGAWGGDFVLATAGENPKTYFAEKGYGTVIPYSNMVL